jgi:hypothetical protein
MDLDAKSPGTYQNGPVSPALLSGNGAAPVVAAGAQASSGGIASTLILSFVIAIALLGALIAVDPWKFLAVTRVLDLLIEGGFVQYHDRQPGFIAGLPDPKYYYWARDPIDWRLIGIAALSMMLYPFLKAIQFHRIAQAYGSTASFDQHVRAYLYGDGLDRFLPFNMGMVGMANALAAHGMPEDKAANAAIVSRVFTVFELVVFGAIGLLILGWSTWFSHIFWALIALGLAYYLVTKSGYSYAAPPLRDLWRITHAAFLDLARSNPANLIVICALSLLAFASIDVAVYVLMAAFHSVAVVIAVKPVVLLMSIVSAYIAARLVPVTPGGIGQWEFGFAASLLLAGQDISLPLLCIGALANLLRITTGLLLMMIVVRGEGVPTSLGKVFSAAAKRADTGPPQRHPANVPSEPPAHRLEADRTNGLTAS